jgi:hypothetical protein
VFKGFFKIKNLEWVIGDLESSGEVMAYRVAMLTCVIEVEADPRTLVLE